MGNIKKYYIKKLLWNNTIITIISYKLIFQKYKL